ncbi:MAG: protein kinase [Anaerolineales bacterium]
MSLKKTFQTTFATYTAIEVIGEGGAGFVYRCQDETGGMFAVKLLNLRNITSEKVKRFKNEITFCRQNRHPNILTVIDDGPYLADGNVIPFYVMPLYDFSLRKLMGKGIPPSSIFPLFSQLLDGVDAAHLMKVVHRDLKPENFLYRSSENRLVVADFGIARFQEEELYTVVETKDNTRLANFQYAAPEQRGRDALVDERSDMGVFQMS